MHEQESAGSGSNPPAWLLDAEGREIPLNRDVVTCGRAEDNDVVVDHTSVSRHHARLERGAAGCEVVDLGSTNGTFINGERILDRDPRLVRDGDRLGFGDCEFAYRATSDPNLAPASGPAPPQQSREHLTQQLFVAVPEIVQVEDVTFAVIRARGVLNSETIESILSTCRLLVEQNVLRILLEARDVEYIDSAGIGGLVRLQRELLALEGGIGIVAPSPAVRQVVELLNLSTFFPMYAEKDQALATVPPDAQEEEEAPRPPVPQTTAAPHLVLPNGQPWPLASRAVSIGSEVGNDIFINNDPQVAPRHARIVQVGEQFVLLDLRSGAGTFLNGERIRDLHLLHHGDEIKLGEAVFRFYGAAVGAGRGTSASAGIALLRFKELPLGDSDLTIGRSAESGLVISDERVSSEHAKIIRANGDYWLLDLGSSNGTFVNEQRVRDVHLLSHGDAIALGATTLTFERRVIRVAEGEPEPLAPLSFIFAEPTGRRWLAVRILGVIAVLLLAGFAVIFVRFILQ